MKSDEISSNFSRGPWFGFWFGPCMGPHEPVVSPQRRPWSRFQVSGLLNTGEVPNLFNAEESNRVAWGIAGQIVDMALGDWLMIWKNLVSGCS